MQPVALLNLSGRYYGQNVTITWKFPQRAPDTVFIAPVNSQTKRVSVQEIQQIPLKNVTTGVSFKYIPVTIHDVTKCEFLVYMGQSGGGVPNFEYMINNPAFTVQVVIGRAHVYYWVDSKTVENGFVRHSLSLQSDFSIEDGILGYSFITDGHRYQALMPDAIGRGRHKFPPFYTLGHSHIEVGLIDGAVAEVSSERRKIFMF